jgi:hypothetical protein
VEESLTRAFGDRSWKLRDVLLRRWYNVDDVGGVAQPGVSMKSVSAHVQSILHQRIICRATLTAGPCRTQPCNLGRLQSRTLLELDSSTLRRRVSQIL